MFRELSLFVLLHNTNFMNKLKLKDFYKSKMKNSSFTVQLSIIYQITPLSTQSKGWST